MRVLWLWLGGLLLLVAGCTRVYVLEPSDVPPPLCLCASATVDVCAPCYDAKRYPLEDRE